MHTCDSPHSPPRLLSHLAAVVLLLTLIASPASADMYKWVDAQGSLHFTDDLASVPARHQRDLASVATGTRDAGFNVVARQTSPTATRTSSMRHVVSLERAGLQMQVLALLNDSVETRFVVDTGAMMNSIPRSVVEELGIRIDARTPRVEVRGISAEPLIAPVVTLRNLRLGDAMLEQVEMVVLDSLETGLLGMSFFKHFRVQTDPVRQTLTLEEISSERNQGDSVLDYEFAWGRVDGASRYQLEISSDQSFRDVVEHSLVNGTSTELRSLDTRRLRPGMYFWRVAAVDAGGSRGPWTAPRDFRYR